MLGLALTLIVGAPGVLPAQADHGAGAISSENPVIAENQLFVECGGDVPDVEAWVDDVISYPSAMWDSIEAAIDEWNSVTSCEGSGSAGDSPIIYLHAGNHDTDIDWSPTTCSVTINGSSTYQMKNVLIFAKGATDLHGNSWQQWTTNAPSDVYEYIFGQTRMCGPGEPALAKVKWNSNPNVEAGPNQPASNELSIFGTLVHEIGHYFYGTSEHLDEDWEVLCPLFNFPKHSRQVHVGW